jgi:hypothetical protein
MRDTLRDRGIHIFGGHGHVIKEGEGEHHTRKSQEIVGRYFDRLITLRSMDQMHNPS